MATKTKAQLAAEIGYTGNLDEVTHKQLLAMATDVSDTSDTSDSAEAEPTAEEIAAVDVDALDAEALREFARYLQGKVAAPEPAPAADGEEEAPAVEAGTRALVIREPAGRGHVFHWPDDGAERVVIDRLPEMEWGYLEWHGSPLAVNGADLPEVRVEPAS